MGRLTVAFSATALLFAARPALAQLDSSTIGYAGLPAKSLSNNDSGVMVGEGLYLHTGVGVEFGYDSNVLYQDTNPTTAAILRVLPFIDLNNQARNTTAPPPPIYFDVSANLQYRHYFTDNPAVSDSGLANTFTPSLAGVVDFSPGQQLGVAVSENFTRSEDPPFVAGAGPIIRDANQATAQVRYSPGGGRLQALLRYTNRLDFFEQTTSGGMTTDLSYANAMTNTAAFDLSWRWLPKTALFFTAESGRVTYLKSTSAKSDSTPLHLLVGLRGLVTERLTTVVSLGYATAFYSNDVNPSGLGLLSARAEVGYRPTPLTSMALGYMHDFQNSIVGNFYNIDGIYGSFHQLIASRVTASAIVRYENRRFQGPDTTFTSSTMPTTSVSGRTDNFFTVGAAVDYYVRNWAYFGVGYNLYLNKSDGDQTPGFSASYIKHQIFARIGVTY